MTGTAALRAPPATSDSRHATDSRGLHSIMQPTILRGWNGRALPTWTARSPSVSRSSGEWWSMLIVRDAFLGVTRFDDFQRRLGISRNILQQRLARLVDAGVLAREPYSEHPPRHDYRLTDKGRDLWPVLTAMRQWGDRHAAPSGPPLDVVHKACGAASDAVLVCSSCGERIGPRDVVARARPGHRAAGILPVRESRGA